MKTIERVLEVDSTLQGEKVAMGIDQSALAHIMGVLTDLYSDPEQAVIREYSTNAYDAHVEAGLQRPIEVTTPTPLAPFFKVRDYGAGLNAEDIRSIYSQYGASTKRDSDDVVGMLGLGCKSALTYTDQFTLQGIKDGVCTQVSVSRDENGAGSMTIVAVYETDEPSGVEVIVPAKSYNEFEDKSMNFFRFWEEGTVLVNGESPKRVSGIKLTDDLLITEETDESYVVMGNVPYPIPYYNIKHNSYIVAWVPIGTVQFTPSREALQMTKLTERALQDLKERVEVEKTATVQRMIDEAENKFTAVGHAINLQRMLGVSGTLEYKGEEIPKEMSRDTTVPMFVVVEGQKRYMKKGWDKTRHLATSVLPNVHWLVGYNGTDFSPYKREKLTLWQQQQGDGYVIPNNYVLVDEVPLPEWIDPSSVYQWEDVNAIKITRNGGTTQNGRPTGSYKGYVGGQYMHTLLAEDIDTSEPIFILGYDENRGMDVIRTKDKYLNATFVQMSANRVAKFQRDFPSARHAIEVAQEVANEWASSLTDEDIAYMALDDNYYEMNMLKALDEATIDDPALVAVIKIAKGGKPSDRVKHEHKFGHWVSLPKVRNWQNPTEKYPLLQARSFYGTLEKEMKDHVILYLNAAYAALSTTDAA